MNSIDKEKVRDLYATATRFERDHAREDLNGAEFDAWLLNHEVKLRIETLQGLLDEIEKLGSNDKTKAYPVIRIMEEQMRIARGEKE